MKDFFLPVRGYEQQYAVSDTGLVRSLDRMTPHGRFRRGVTLAQSCGPHGYRIVQLSKDGAARTFRVHRLVAEAFVANPEEKPDVHHRDHRNDNNRAENLCWVTPRENMGFAVSAKRTGAMNNPKVAKKLSKEEVAEIRRLHKLGWTQVALGERFDVAHSNIGFIVRNQGWVA